MDVLTLINLSGYLSAGLVCGIVANTWEGFPSKRDAREIARNVRALFSLTVWKR